VVEADFMSYSIIKKPCWFIAIAFNDALSSLNYA